MDDEWLPSEIFLVDQSPQIVKAWRSAFATSPEVVVLDGDYFQQPADAIVSPANSFGIMDGGLDLALRDRLGVMVQHRLQSVIVERHHGELHVGQAEIVETANVDWPYMVAAPTMRVPEIVAHSINAYVAFRAILLEIENFNRALGVNKIRSVVCCGLCTGVGAMPPERCAGQMYLAYKAMLLPAKIGRFESIHEFHKSLRSL